MKMNAGRRKILLASASMLLPTAAFTVQVPRLNTISDATKTRDDETLFAASVDFIKRYYVQHNRPVVYSPVARLQRELLLEYSAARELVAALETADIWDLSNKLDIHIATINRDSPHLRC